MELNKPTISKKSESTVRKTRKKSNYRKVNNELRQELIEMVYLKDYLLKDAAKLLQINYSTAKTILRIFRIEKRVEKKNAEEERQLKSYLTSYKNKSTDENSHNSVSNNEHNLYKQELNKLEKSIKDISAEVKNCYENIIVNQNRINYFIFSFFDGPHKFQQFHNVHQNIKHNFEFISNLGYLPNQSICLGNIDKIIENSETNDLKSSNLQEI